MKNKSENVLYVRSNTSGSSPLQLNNGENYGKQKSLILRVIEDSDTSGFTPLNDRSGMSELLYLIKTGVTKAIVIDSLHRISRDAQELYYFVSLHKEHNVQLIILGGGALN